MPNNVKGMQLQILLPAHNAPKFIDPSEPSVLADAKYIVRK